MKTLTLDNDLLFQTHVTLEKLLDIKIYFCHPYHSWEKGSVENRNKIIRKFIPKSSDLSHYDRNEVKVIESYLNDRYLKCLKYSTPREKLEIHHTRKKGNKKKERNISIYGDKGIILGNLLEQEVWYFENGDVNIDYSDNYYQQQ